MIKIITLTVLAVILNSCGSKISLNQYYFDSESFQNGKIYEFTDKNNPQRKQYWHIFTTITDNDTILITEGLENNERPVEVFKEKIQTQGSNMLDYYFIQYDEEGNSSKVPSVILKDEVFSQSPNKYSLMWKVVYEGLDDKEEMQKTRTLIKTGTEQIIHNEKYDCVLFRDDFVVKKLKSGATLNFYQNSYYARGFGLVRFERHLSDGTILDFRLTKITTTGK